MPLDNTTILSELIRPKGDEPAHLGEQKIASFKGTDPPPRVRIGSTVHGGSSNRQNNFDDAANIFLGSLQTGSGYVVSDAPDGIF